MLRTVSFSLISAFLFLAPNLAHSRILNANELIRLLDSDEEGTTVVFHPKFDRIFYSSSLQNTLRRSRVLGRSFIKKYIRNDTLREGVFIGTFDEGSQAKSRSGVAGIVADKASGNGIVILIETFVRDASLKSFETTRRKYMILLVIEDEGGVRCKRSRWNTLSDKGAEPKFATEHCEFIVGNAVTLKKK